MRLHPIHIGDALDEELFRPMKIASTSLPLLSGLLAPYIGLIIAESTRYVVVCPRRLPQKQLARLKK